MGEQCPRGDDEDGCQLESAVVNGLRGFFGLLVVLTFFSTPILTRIFGDGSVDEEADIQVLDILPVCESQEQEQEVEEDIDHIAVVGEEEDVDQIGVLGEEEETRV